MSLPAPFRFIAVLSAAALAPAASAQWPADLGGDAPRAFVYEADPFTPADAATVARAREVLEPLTAKVPGLAVADATAVDPLTVRLADDHPGAVNLVRRALRDAGLLSGGLGGGSPGGNDLAGLADMLRHSIAEMDSDVPLPHPIPANLPPFAREAQERMRDTRERTMTADQRTARLEAHRDRRERMTGGSGPTVMRAGLNGPLGDRIAAARGALAGVDPKLSAAFVTAPAADHRSLVVRFDGTRLDADRIRLAFLEAGVPLDGGAAVRPVGEDETDAAGDGERAAIGARLLTISYSPPPNGDDLPNLSGRMRQALDEAGVPGAKLLVADAPGRTYVIGFDGDERDGWAIESTLRHTALAEHRAATTAQARGFSAEPAGRGGVRGPRPPARRVRLHPRGRPGRPGRRVLAPDETGPDRHADAEDPGARRPGRECRRRPRSRPDRRRGVPAEGDRSELGRRPADGRVRRLPVGRRPDRRGRPRRRGRRDRSRHRPRPAGLSASAEPVRPRSPGAAGGSGRGAPGERGRLSPVGAAGRWVPDRPS